MEALDVVVGGLVYSIETAVFPEDVALGVLIGWFLTLHWRKQ
jgi:hypothetical protein